MGKGKGKGEQGYCGRRKGDGGDDRGGKQRRGGRKRRWKKRNELRAEIIHKHSRRLRHGCDGVFLDDCVGREDAFCEALDHGAREAEVLHF